MTHLLFILKAVLGVSGLALYTWHLTMADNVEGRAQQLRYLALLAASGTLAYASVKQMYDHDGWTEVQTFGLITGALIVLAAIASLRDDRSTTLRCNYRPERTDR